MTFSKDFRTLIVADAQSVGALSDMLRGIGLAKIEKATGAADAQRVLTQIEKPVDCVLCDYALGEGNGLELLKQIRLGRVQRVRPDVCFILLARGQPVEVVKAAAELDVSGFLVNALSGTVLDAAITKARKRTLKIDYDKYRAAVLPLT